MSWKASGWAKDQKTGSPSAKALLLVIADCWNPQYHCIEAQETLAGQSEQSIDSVQLRLWELQERGLIARERRPKLGGDGGRSSDKIIVLMPGVEYKPGPRTIPLGPIPFKLAKARSRRRKNSAGVTPQDAALGTIAALPQGQLRPSNAAPVPVCEVPERHEPLREPIREPTPPKPPAATETWEIGLPENDRAIEHRPTFAEFWERYRPDAAMSRSEAEREWHRLSSDDQRNALAAIDPYFADCQSKERQRRAAVNFLRGRIFDGFAQGADAIAQAPASECAIAQREFVEEGSDEWRAWERHLQGRGKTGSAATDYSIGGKNLRGWWFPTRLPPDHRPNVNAQQPASSAGELERPASAEPSAVAPECDQHFERVDAGALEMVIYVAHVREREGERSAASVELLAARQGFVMVPARWLSIARRAIEQSGTEEIGAGE